MKITGNYAASNFFRKRNIVLDLQEQCYKIYDKLFSIIPFTEGCKKIPTVDYILVFRTLYAKCEDCSLEEFETGNASFVQVSLVHRKNRRLIVHETKNKKEAFELANRLSKHFGVRLRDAATNRHKPTWLTAT